MSKKIIKYEGELNLNGFVIPCYVLEDGTRVISSRAMQNALKLTYGDSKKEESKSGVELSRFIASNWFKSLIDSEIELEHFQPITCYKGNQKINGYEATTLVDLCSLILDARKYGLLKTERQETIAQQCEILVQAFAKVGIIALVDEATGYQHDREKDALQTILSAYISKELLPWQKRFPDEFYKEIFRLNGWDYTVNGINKRPGIIGTWTIQLIYNLLPPGVRQELENVTPKNEQGQKTAKLHQSLTIDIGNPTLEKQLLATITLMNVSDTWTGFKKLFQKKFAQYMMDNGIPAKAIKIDPPDKISNEPPNLFTGLDDKPKKLPPPTSGDDDLDNMMGDALNKGKPPEK